MKVAVEIPEDIYQALRLPKGEIDRELRLELACALYHRQVLSFGKARKLAQMSKWEFQEILGQRKIPRHYSAEDLEEDLKYAKGRQ